MPANEDDLYQDHVLDHYEDPYHRGPCEGCTHRHEDDNPLCGDVVRIELAVDPAGTIREAWFGGEGCCISQSAASMLVEHVEGKSVEEARHFTADDMLRLFAARLTPNRQKCALLSWRVMQEALFSPVDGSENGGTPRGGPTFAGPDLGEES
jgi:nitrogen fixation NifU-like protein